MTKSKYDKDTLLDVIIDSNKTMVSTLQKVESAISAINDNNVLHSKTIEANTEAIRQIKDSNAAILSFFRFIITAIILALIVLAGAEKVLKFLPIS